MGPYIEKGLGFLLIKSTHSENKELKRGKAQELPS